MADNRTRTYNTITAVILAVTLVVCLVVVFLAATASGQTLISAEPTLIDPSAVTQTVAAPTSNPTSTGDAAVEALATLTFTPSPEPSQTPTEASTPTPTSTPTETPEETEESEEEPTATPTEKVSETTTPTATVTATSEADDETQADYEYILRDGDIEYVSNFANDAGCDWMGIAGQVFDAEGEPVNGLYVHVTDSEDFDIRVKSGDTPVYGDSGWEVYLADQPTEGMYTVQLETEDGEQISEEVSIQTTDSCDMNLVLLVFEQSS